MACRIVSNHCLRRLAAIHKAQTVFPCATHSSKWIEAGKQVNNRLFIRNYAAAPDAQAAQEIAAQAIDLKNASKDRSKVIPVEVGMKYLKSEAYNTTYGTDPVWVKYRRNFKGQFAPETRKTCIRQEKLSTGNPCPICRDEYLVLDYRNVDLLKQFISPHNGSILPTKKTGLCQKRYTELLVAISKAKDYGLLTFDLPIRDYDYSDYKSK